MQRFLVAAAAAVAVLATAVGAPASNEKKPIDHSSHATTLSVIGDTPYGSSQVATFPQLLAAINADPDVNLVMHLGDMKSGSSHCSNDYFAWMAGQVATLEDPFVLTPGDNDWTDCLRADAGRYLPTERLAHIRSTFYPVPGMTVGGSQKPVLTQADMPGFESYVENQLWFESRVAFSTLHVVGSNNGLAKWSSSESPERRLLRLAEYDDRLAADLAWLDRIFAFAKEEHAAGVVVAMQADMWDGATSGAKPIVERLAQRASEFGGPVLLLEGDSHHYRVDQPLAFGSPIHGVTTAAPNVTRLVVEGENTREWLKLTVDPKAAELFSWERKQR